MGEDVGEANTALEAALVVRIDLGIEDDDGLRERRGAFNLLRRGTGLRGGEGAIFNDGVETSHIGQGDGTEEFLPSGGLNARSDDVYEALHVALLPPVADHEEERLVDFELAECIAEIHGRAVFGGFRINRHLAVEWIGGGGDVPFLRVARRRVAVEKRVAHPCLKNEAVQLDLLGGEEVNREREENNEAQGR